MCLYYSIKGSRSSSKLIPALAGGGKERNLLQLFRLFSDIKGGSISGRNQASSDKTFGIKLGIKKNIYIYFSFSDTIR